LAGSNETLARSVASFTDASTPSSLFSRRSIRPAQTAHTRFVSRSTATKLDPGDSLEPLLDGRLAVTAAHAGH